MSLDAVATKVAGTPVTVECVRKPLEEAGKRVPDARGWVWFRGGSPDHTLYLRIGVCNALEHAQDAASDPQVGAAMEILTHEALHASGIEDEVEAECLAHANVWQTIRQFKLPAAAARVALDDAAAFHRSLDSSTYHPETCP